MRKKEGGIRRHAEAAFAEELAANTVVRKAASDAADNRQVLLTRIAEQRALRLAKTRKDRPPINGKKLPG
jgi:hypothetical protein